MAGIVQSQLPQATASLTPPTGDPSATPMTPEGIEGRMHLPPQVKQVLDQVVLAGLKVMFSPQTHKMMLAELAKPGPMPLKVGQGVTGLIGILFQESNHSIPPQILIPAGLILIAHVQVYLEKMHEPMSAADFGKACQIMVELLLKSFHIDPKKLPAAIAQHQASVQSNQAKQMNNPDPWGSSTPQGAQVPPGALLPGGPAGAGPGAAPGGPPGGMPPPGPGAPPQGGMIQQAMGR